LYACAIRIGEARGHLSAAQAATQRATLAATAQAAAETLVRADAPMRQLAADTLGYTGEFVFCGSGPNYASALFCAAKMLEATGDAAIGQDVEEWAHLQYFAKTVETPTFVLSARDRDSSRLNEVLTAMHTIKRQVIEVDYSAVPEVFAPLVSSIPPMLFASYRAELLGEPYFRAFTGGRSIEDGGGISRIRTSDLVA
jgi:glutamine---fructose-6-phosphate transaminase (isomerizing)